MLTCSRCHKEIDDSQVGPLGEHFGECGRDENEQPVCYVCCAIWDSELMKAQHKTVLYLSKSKTGQWLVSNWPGTLQIRVHQPRKGRHNIARTRYDVWFRYAGLCWHGVQYGEWTQILHCKVVKPF
jgi:hypothetical protein